MAIRTWTWVYGMLGLIVMASILSLAALPAQAKNAPRSNDSLENCNWNHPGVNPFMGDVVNAIDRYTDIPVAVRDRLKQRMRDRNYDEIVTINRDSITGKQNYNPRISEMYFGTGRICRNVTRTGWTEQMKERGLVYCEQGHCILVPTVCRNVSRITRVPASATPASAAAGGPAGAAVPAAAPAAPATAPGDELRGGSFNTDAQPPAVTGGAGGIGLPLLPSSPDIFSSSVSGTGMPGGSGGGFGGTPVSPGHPIDGINGPDTPTVLLVLSPVPEPETWSMLLAGLALLVFSVWRNKRQAA